MTRTMNVVYVRRDTSIREMWSERKTFASFLDELRYEYVLRDHFKYALRDNFDSRTIFVNVEPKK